MKARERLSNDILRVLMLGWEFPPYISGGLGTACYGLTKGLSELGTSICFLLPRPVPVGYSSHVRLISSVQDIGVIETGEYPQGQNVELKALNVSLYPYVGYHQPNVPVGASYPGQNYESPSPGLMYNQSEKDSITNNPGSAENYGNDMETQINRYCSLARQAAVREDYDVIHAHDWMTFPAATSIAKLTRKPLVVHVHSTEYDRSGECVNPGIYAYERQGMHLADRVIAVSKMTGRICRDRYGVPENKLQVVYNGVEPPLPNTNISFNKKDPEVKVVLFLGRITMQKGPEYFVRAAKRVLEKTENVKFIMAGNGDMFTHIIEMTAGLGIGHKVLFAGFLRGKEVERILGMADLLVMPSVSEPFGICPLEAMIHRVPVIISKQSGVAEILSHALQVDFWDINEMANKIISILRHPPLQEVLSQNGCHEAQTVTWQKAALNCQRIYQDMIREAG